MAVIVTDKTTTDGNKMSKRTPHFIDILFVFIAVSVAIFIVFIGYKISVSEHKIFSISLIALFGGLLFESFRISDNWSTVGYIFIGTLIFSLFSFLPIKHDFDKDLQSLPYIFLLLFTLFSALFHSDKTTAKLTEGITLLQSISIIYWIFDYGFMNIGDWFVKFLIILALIFSAFSIFNALTTFVLSRTTRLTLSIWSSIIMLLFGIDNVYRVYQNENIETTKYLSQGVYIGLQFFLLGVSSMYIVQNAMMLVRILPGRGSFFNSAYFNELRELKDEHIERYSDQQAYIGHSIFCTIITGTLYWLNYKYEFLPRHTMIWIGFMFFPLILRLTAYRPRRRNYR